MPTFQILEAEMVMRDCEPLIVELGDEHDPFQDLDLDTPPTATPRSTGSGRALVRWLHRVMISAY